MTRQEAIKILKAKFACMEREVRGTDEDCNKRNCLNCDLCYKQGTMGEQMEVLQMAIDALNDVSDRNVGDMISRQVALKEIEEWISALYENAHHESASDGKMILNAIKHLPPAQPEPCEDCVSRKAVIRLLYSGYHSKSMIDEVNELPLVRPEPSTEIQEILDYLDTTLHPIVSPDNWNVYAELYDMISNLTSVHPNYDCVLKQFGDCTYDTTGCSDCVIKAKIKAALSAQPEPQWIPCSERLPEDMQFVLLTVRRLKNEYNLEPFISVGYIGWNQQHWWCAHDGECEISKVEVIAWMPLPKVYGGEPG